MKLAEWNIHKMTNDISVKKYVIDTLIGTDADVICLVEYLTDRGIEESLKDRYWCEESDTVSGNKVFIAVRKELAPDGVKIKNKDEVVGCYNFLHVAFALPDQRMFSVIGTRMLSPIDASKQTPQLRKYLGRLSAPFVCMGDFNILSHRMGKWFPDIAMENIEGANHPLGNASMIYADRYTKKIVGYGAVDHMLHSDDIVVKSEYNWDFLMCDLVYPKIDDISRENMWNIPAAYPDHALMISEVTIDA